MNKTYIPALATGILLSVLNVIATANHWFVRYQGFDIFMHVLGGVALAFAIYWIMVTFFPRYKYGFWFVVLGTFILGVGWEVFEAVYEIAGAPVGTTKYYLDTVKDLVNDTLGAIIVCFILKK